MTTANFVKSTIRSKDYPKDRRPEFAFLGRSNVGKSSLMNALLGKKGLAKTSSTPGKTQTINFFDVNERFYFVDLPGYGFAKAPLKVKAQWGRVVNAYIEEREPLRLVVMLLDSRHAPSAQDHVLLEFLDRVEVPTLLVATKFDKLKRSERKRNLERIREALALSEDALVVPFSAVTREGKKELWAVIEEILSEKAGQS
ncbi:MAG: ribosome biogenesis GTP-binding protein YihA/YsxC [Candidatus Hydrogenedentes bacterium]|nr:ribosome biogenesis GTP-binding protein YihA/YsxC [Candidatus Hydrogenedentota bacterium]